MLKSARHLEAIWTCLALSAGLAAAAAAAPASAQAMAETTTGEVVVTGQYYVGPNVKTLSAPVSYRDLDLTTDAGREALKQRVKTTASDLCKRLGEGGMGGTVAMTSCEQAAVNSAAEQERVAIAQAPKAYAVNPPQPAPAVPSAAEAPAAPSYAQPAATVTPAMTTNGPVPDTVENRTKFGGPMSAGGRRTKPAGN